MSGAGTPRDACSVKHVSPPCTWRELRDSLFGRRETREPVHTDTTRRGRVPGPLPRGVQSDATPSQLHPIRASLRESHELWGKLQLLTSDPSLSEEDLFRKSVGENFLVWVLHKPMGFASLHKSMGAASLHKSMGDASLHKSMGALHPCTSQWVMHPCTSQWVLHPCTSQWVLHPCTSQWELHPCTSQWVLHPCTSRWVMHPCASQLALAVNASVLKVRQVLLSWRQQQHLGDYRSLRPLRP